MDKVRLPTSHVIKHYLGYGSLIYLLFALVYGGTNWWSAQQTDLFHFFFEWELRTPFIPAWIYVYLSLSLFFLIPMFVLQAHQFTPLLWSFVAIILFSGLLFLIFPTEAGAIRPSVIQGYEKPFSLLYALDLPHNLFPSLHISLTTLCLLALFSHLKGSLWFLPVVFWWAAMALSVFFVHQHYLIDVIGGFIVAFLCYKLVYLKLHKQTGHKAR